MRLALLVACVFLATQPASAGPFGEGRSEGAPPTKRKQAKKTKQAKKAFERAKKPSKPAVIDEELIIIEESTSKPAAKVSKTRKKPAADEELVVIEDDEGDANVDEANSARVAKLDLDSGDPLEPADDLETPTGVVATARKPSKRTTRFYFRAGGFRQSSKIGATEFGLETDLPIDISSGNLGAGSGVAMQQSQIPVGVIIGYVLPVQGRKLSLETVLGFPTKTKFQATGALATESLAPTFMGMPTGIEALGSDLGEATFAPPMLTAVYRIADFGPVTPIAGAGIMLLMARNAKITNSVLNEAGDPKLSISPSPGLVLQGGLEARITKRIAARLDIKYVFGMKVNARIEDIAVTPKAIPALGSIEVGDAVMSAKVTPLVVTAGVGADF